MLRVASHISGMISGWWSYIRIALKTWSHNVNAERSPFSQPYREHRNISLKNSSRPIASRNRDIAWIEIKYHSRTSGFWAGICVLDTAYRSTSRVYASTESYFSLSSSFSLSLFYTRNCSRTGDSRSLLLSHSTDFTFLQFKRHKRWMTLHTIRCNEIICLENESASIILWLTAIDPRATMF